MSKEEGVQSLRSSSASSSELTFKGKGWSALAQPALRQCYRCGNSGHFAYECVEIPTFDEYAKRPYRFGKGGEHVEDGSNLRSASAPAAVHLRGRGGKSGNVNEAEAGCEQAASVIAAVTATAASSAAVSGRGELAVASTCLIAERAAEATISSSSSSAAAATALVSSSSSSSSSSIAAIGEHAGAEASSTTAVAAAAAIRPAAQSSGKTVVTATSLPPPLPPPPPKLNMSRNKRKTEKKKKKKKANAAADLAKLEKLRAEADGKAKASLDTEAIAASLAKPKIQVDLLQCERCKLMIRRDLMASHMTGHSTEVFASEDGTWRMYLGGERNAHNHKELTYRCGVGAVLNVAWEVGCHFPTECVYLKMPFSDVKGEDISKGFEIAANFLDECRGRKIPVLVHCVQGISRSTSIVLYWLVKSQGWTLKRAYQHVLSKRPIIRPHKTFVKQLAQAEANITGQEPSLSLEDVFKGVKMLELES